MCVCKPQGERESAQRKASTGKGGWGGGSGKGEGGSMALGGMEGISIQQESS